jgi:hypothetical protein
MSKAPHQGRLVRGLLIRAFLLAGWFAAVHLLGWREHTTVLCGMAPVSGGAAWLAVYSGVVYILSYLLATLLAPVLLIAAAVAWILERRGGG